MRVFFAVGAVLCLLPFALLGACADALHIAPPGEGGGVAVGGGGAAPVPCDSTLDCPPEQPVCDTIKGVCAECLEVEDCSLKPGTVCGHGQCVCPTEGHTWCAPGDCIDLQTSGKHCGRCDHACFGACADGACVDPWEPVALAGAPSPRARHVAVWSGDDADGRLIVWGGTPDDSGTFGNGGVYDPATSTWSTITPVGAPTPRMQATAVWAGSVMVVWGGRSGGTYFNDGSRFDPASNTWQPMTGANAPQARVNHTAVWTGNRMIVWGGSNSDGDQLADGGRYDPVADSWEPMASAPTAREMHSAVWNDVIDAMWVYGGFGDVSGNPNIYLPAAGEPGGRSYDPGADGWDTLQVTGEPSARALHSAVFDGTRMIVFGGTDGMDELSTGHKLEGNSWSALMGGAPGARRDHTAVWIAGENKMVVFGGRRMGVLLGDGGVYDSASVAWTASVPNAIEPRIFHTAVSTGSRMFVWGGFGPGGALQTGGVYRP